jgi:hypothetical protein
MPKRSFFCLGKEVQILANEKVVIIKFVRGLHTKLDVGSEN